MPDAHALFVFDTAVLSNFALAGRIALLRQRYAKHGAVSCEVLAEIAAGIAAGHERLRSVFSLVDDRSFRMLSLSEAERNVYVRLRRNLGSGEASCLALAGTRHAIVVTDDRMARGVCDELGLRYTGTVGILVASCREKMLSPEEADGVLAAMIDAGFFSPVNRITGVL